MSTLNFTGTPSICKNMNHESSRSETPIDDIMNSSVLPPYQFVKTSSSCFVDSAAAECSTANPVYRSVSKSRAENAD